MRRSSRLAATVLTVFLVVPAAGAWAATAQDRVEGDTVEVTIDRDGVEFTDITDVRVRVADTDTRDVGDWVEGLECVEETCDRGAGVYRVPIVGPVGEALSTTPPDNGALVLDVEYVLQIGGERRHQVETILHVASAGVRDVAAAVADDGTVRLEWTAAPEADVTRYEVVRLDSQWRRDLGPNATSLTDEPGPGQHRYRITTVRPGGSGGSLATTSGSVAVDVAPQPPEPDTAERSPGDDRPAGDDDGAADEEPGETSERAGDDRREPAEAGEDDRTARDTTPRRPGRSGTVAEAPRLGSDRTGVPDVPTEDEGFRGELDYGTDDPDDPDAADRGTHDGSVVDDEVVLAGPGGSTGSFLGADGAERVAVPVAAGLLLTAIALHLWRWLKVPLR